VAHVINDSFAGDLTFGVDRVGNADYSGAQRAQIGHCSIGVDKAMKLRIVGRAGHSSDLAPGINKVRGGHGATKRSDIGHGAGGVNKAVRVGGIHSRLTDNGSGIVDLKSSAVIGTQGSKIGENAVRPGKRVGAAGSHTGLADHETTAIKSKSRTVIAA